MRAVVVARRGGDGGGGEAVSLGICRRGNQPPPFPFWRTRNAPGVHLYCPDRFSCAIFEKFIGYFRVTAPPNAQRNRLRPSRRCGTDGNLVRNDFIWEIGRLGDASQPEQPRSGIIEKLRRLFCRNSPSFFTNPFPRCHVLRTADRRWRRTAPTTLQGNRLQPSRRRGMDGDPLRNIPRRGKVFSMAWKS